MVIGSFLSLAIIILLILPYLQFEQFTKVFRSTIFAIIAGLFFAKLIAAVFFLVDDIRRWYSMDSRKIIFFKYRRGKFSEGRKNIKVRIFKLGRDDSRRWSFWLTDIWVWE